jgi:hypothetical protein
MNLLLSLDQYLWLFKYAGFQKNMRYIEINTKGTLNPPKIAHLAYPGSLIDNQPSPDSLPSPSHCPVLLSVISILP